MLFKDKKIWQIVLVVAGLGLLFYLYSFLALDNNSFAAKAILNSPDETANLFFADLFAKESTLKFVEPLNNLTDRLIVPRSMRSVNGFTVPASFIGLPLIYGLLAKFLGDGIIPYLTPFLAVLGLWFLYLLFRSFLFTKRLPAALTTGLAAIFPGWWYFAARGLMPNVAFCALLIMSLYFLLAALKSGKIGNYIAFGIFTALSLMIRTSEFLWVFWIFGALLFFNRAKINWLKLVLAGAIFALFFSPVFYFNLQNYGSILSIGYADLNFLNDAGFTSHNNLFLTLLLPFGFHPLLIIKNAFNYSFGLFSFWSILLIFSWAWLVRFGEWQNKIFKKRFTAMVIIYLPVLFYLLSYYGSWRFSDNPDPKAITIGASYIRYFLPLYLFALPPLGYLLWRLFLKKGKGVLLGCFLILLLVGSSWRIVMSGSNDSLFSVRNNLVIYQESFKEVISDLPAKSVIISGRWDKVFFPAVPVIYQLKVSADYDKIRTLLNNGWNVYQLTDNKLLTSVSEPQRSFLANDLRLSEVKKIFAGNVLYRVRFLND